MAQAHSEKPAVRGAIASGLILVLLAVWLVFGLAVGLIAQ
jgi:hypothetical protein